MRNAIKIRTEISGILMYLRGLAETIILQSIEDLWSSRYRENSVKFFKGNGFIICSEIAGLNSGERHRILRLLKRVLI